LLFEFDQCGFRVFRINSPALDSSFAGFKRCKELLIGGVRIGRVVSRCRDEFAQFYSDGSDTFFSHLLTAGSSSDNKAKRLGDLLRFAYAVRRRHLTPLLA
jgi:hypothetical protein